MIRKAYRDSLILGQEQSIEYSYEVNILNWFFDYSKLEEGIVGPIK